MRVQVLAKGLMASFVLAIFVSTPSVAQMDDRQAMVDLVIQIQQLQDEVRMLRGMLEDQTLELENLSNRQRDQYLDLDQRITDVRGNPQGPLVTTGAATIAGTNPPTPHSWVWKHRAEWPNVSAERPKRASTA